MVYCCIPFCKSESKKGTPERFHEFPSDMIVRLRWLRVIPRPGFKINDKSRSSVVCSRHFLKDDYVPGLKIRKLKKEAVPSVFPECPRYEVPKLVPQKRKFELCVPNEQVEKKLKIGNELKITENVAEPQMNLPENTDLLRKEEVAECLANLPKRICFIEKKENMEVIPKAYDETNAVSTRRLESMRSLLLKKNKIILLQQEEIESMKKKLKSYEQNPYFSAVKKVLGLADQGGVKASALLQQLESYI